MTLSEALAQQRWDDHRYYHHNRINQALHLVSALSFIAAYVLLFVDPFAAVMLAWLVAMPAGSSGTSGSSPMITTRSTRPPTSTRKRSRSVTTCGAKPSS